MLERFKIRRSEYGIIRVFFYYVILSTVVSLLLYHSKFRIRYETPETLQTVWESSVNNSLYILKTRETPSNIKLLEPMERSLSCNGCMNLKFEFLVNNVGLCTTGNQSIKLLLLITSAPKNYLARETIRNTWLTLANQNKDEIRYVFLLGNSTKNEEIEKENDQKHDIILGNFTDAYSNLTFKTLMGFYWTLEFCNKTKYVIKTDDDMYVNIPALLKRVCNNEEALQTSIGGSCSLKASPIRNKWSKWYASIKSYPQKSYPGFCSGTGYVTSKNVVYKIVHISKYIPFFHLEDVYIALCIKALKYKLLPLKGFMYRPKFEPCRYKDNSSVVTAHQVPLKWKKYIWNTPC